MQRLALSLALTLTAAVMLGSPVRAGDAKPLVVVELFQSQGCSSCPPAEANLNAIAGDPEILALSFGVTYWDQLGWKDTFAKAQYTDRQWDYARHRQRGTVWTPQVYVDGHTDLVGADRSKLDQAIAQARRSATAPGPSLQLSGNKLDVGQAQPAVASDVWLVRYDPRTLDVAIRAGENGGRTLPHRNVVRQLVRLGSWNGAARSFTVLAPSEPGLSTAALVQVHTGGDIVSAAKLDSNATPANATAWVTPSE